MAAGDIELQPLRVERQDEVGDLVQGFNFLLSRLEEVTNQKLAAERLRLAEKERMEIALRHLLADTSHELRTPITVLRAQIEALQDGIFLPDTRRLNILHDEVMGMARLVETLFTLARSDIGQLECRSDPIDIFAVLDHVVSAFRNRYAEAGMTIAWTEGADRGPVVIGDVAGLRQVFANLLENTLRYTDPGGRLVVSCRTGARDTGDHAVTLTFDDTAPGVPAEALPRLFERFFRVETSRSRAGGGSGIGLALCQSLVAAHGGAISAEASPLGGLRVTVRLPCIEAS
jgi:two-component system sensor histidine kinase BaeS